MRSDQDTDHEHNQDIDQELASDEFGENELQKNSRLMLGLISLFVVAVVVFVLAQNGGAFFQRGETEQTASVSTTYTSPPSRPATGKWKTRIETNPLDDSRMVIMAVEANRGPSSLQEPVHLVLRCKSTKTDVILQWGKPLDEQGARVSTRVGDSPSHTETWNLSTDERATFYDGDKTLFLNNLLGAHRFVAQTTPRGKNPITAIFDISGLDKALEPARQICGW